jgi:hypothetical protein
MDTVTQLRRFTADGAHALLPHWQLALRAEAKSPGTIDTYTYGLRTYLTWCGRHGEPPLARTTMTTWMSAMLDAGATCLGRCRGLRGAADGGQAAVMTPSSRGWSERLHPSPRVKGSAARSSYALENAGEH